MRYTLFILSIFLLFGGATSAQVTYREASKKALKYFDESHQYVSTQQWDKAEEALLKALDKEPEFIDAMIRLGDLYYFTKKYESAIESMNRSIALDSFYATKPYYIAGMSSRYLHQFKDAAAYFDSYLKLPNIPPGRRQEIQMLLDNSQFAAEAVENPVLFNPVNLGTAINTNSHEYLPTLVADESQMYFTRRKGELEDIYSTQRTDTTWSQAEMITSNINTENFGEGSQAISPDGKTLYFAADYGAYGRRGWDIYETQWRGDGWSDPQMMGVPVNSIHYESQPSISADGRSLYFCSRREGGMGGKDIWVSYLQEDCTWGEPVNLGPNVNTPNDEEVPFIHPDNETLYFGSDGHIGIGGSDLFMVRRDTSGNWGKPMNLGYPINTLYNEGSIFVTTDGSRAYYASDQYGGEGGYDLYRFDLWEAVKPQPVTYVRIQIVDAQTKEQLEAEFSLYDLETGKLIASSNCQTYLKTDFLICLPAGKPYGLNIESPGYLLHSEHFALAEKKSYEPENMFIGLKRIEVGNTLVLHNILFETDKAALQPSSRIELDKMVNLLNSNSNLQLEIRGHTDNVGTPAYNLQLSKDRAKAVYNYLVKAGIEPERLQHTGLGDTKPIASNDTEEGRAQNRRTEFRIKTL